MQTRCALRNSGAAGSIPPLPNDEPDPAARSRGRVGEIGNAMRTHAPREQEPRHLSPRPAAPGSARRRRTSPRRRWAWTRTRRTGARRARARDARDAEARAAAAARDEDRHAGEHDESRDGARAPAQAVASSHGIGGAYAQPLLRFDVLNLDSRQAESCDRDPSNPRSPLKLRDTHAAAVTRLSRVLTGVSKRRVRYRLGRTPSVSPAQRRTSASPFVSGRKVVICPVFAAFEFALLRPSPRPTRCVIPFGRG